MSRRLFLSVVAALSVFGVVSGVRAQSDTWDSLLSNSQWYVPAADMLAYLTANSTFSNPVAIADQTIWGLGDCDNGVFTGLSEAVLKIGPITANSTSAMNGVITDSGQVRIVFTREDSPPTVGIGQAREIEGTTYLEMQMISGSDGTYVSHWAYMAPYDGNPGSLPPLEIESSLRSEEWDWMPGTSWSLQNADLFGEGGTGFFQIDDYRNGYFWGSGTGPEGSAAEEFTLLGSATPEGNILFNVLSNGVLTSLAGQITGDAADGQMALRFYDGSPDFGELGYAHVVPEPASIVLLGLGVIAVVLRNFHHRARRGHGERI